MLVQLVCGLEHLHFDKNDVLSSVLPIAGDLHADGGSDFTFKATVLAPSASDEKLKDRHGLRLVLGGGAAPLGEPELLRPQRAVIDFICDPKRTGLEGEWEGEDRYETSGAAERRGETGVGQTEDEKKEGDGAKEDVTKNHQLIKDGAALVFDGYGPASGADSKTDELRLTWYTEAACVDKRDDGSGGAGGDSGSHWGLFTWLTIM